MLILVTGGAGFIGSHVVESISSGDRIRVLDDLSSGKRTNIETFGAELIVGSITDRHVVAKAMEGVDYVYHLAAFISVPESMEKPQACVDLNVTGLLNVLQAAAAAKVKKVCFISSAAVYGDGPESPKTEDRLPRPRSPYATTKLAGEYFCRQFAESHGLPTVSVRLFNVYGPRQSPESTYAAVVPAFVKRAIRGEPLTIFGDGQQTRDLVYVKDVAAALVHLTQNTRELGPFNIGSGTSITIKDLAQKVVRLAGNKSEIRFAPPRAGDIRDSQSSIERLTSAGYSPRYTLDQGLAETIQSFNASAK